MAEPVAAGNFRDCIDAGRTLLAGSATFQTLVGAADAAAALALINRDVRKPKTGGDDGDELTFPLARVWADDYSRKNAAIGTWPTGGTLRLMIVAEAPDAYDDDPDWGEAWMSNVLGGIVDDMTSLVATGGYLYAREITQGHPEQQSKDDATPVWRGDITIPFGVEA